MPLKQRILRAAATVALALAGTVAMALPAGAAAAPASGGHTVAGAGALRPQTGPLTSLNWAGYVSSEPSGYFSTVAGIFQLSTPSSCSISPGNSPDLGVSLDGYSNSTLEFAGVVGDCGSTGQIRWHPCVGLCPPPPWSSTPYGNQGDIIEATVSYLSGSVFKGTIQDLTQGWTVSSNFTVSGALRNSAEAIAADTLSGSLVPMNNFGTATFRSVTVNGSTPLNAVSPVQINMISTSGALMVATSPISSGGAFALNWVSAGP
jgi:Peptidase A4 family